MSADPSGGTERISVSELAALGGVSVSYLRRLAREGEMGSAKAEGSGWTFDRETAVRWAASRSGIATDDESWMLELLAAEATEARAALGQAESAHRVELLTREAESLRSRVGELEAELGRQRELNRKLVESLQAVVTD